jgi:hypothetical protein
MVIRPIHTLHIRTHMPAVLIPIHTAAIHTHIPMHTLTRMLDFGVATTTPTIMPIRTTIAATMRTGMPIAADTAIGVGTVIAAPMLIAAGMLTGAPPAGQLAMRVDSPGMGAAATVVAEDRPAN